MRGGREEIESRYEIDGMAGIGEPERRWGGERETR